MFIQNTHTQKKRKKKKEKEKKKKRTLKSFRVFRLIILVFLTFFFSKVQRPATMVLESDQELILQLLLRHSGNHK
jgi:hypothetical protein